MSAATQWLPRRLGEICEFKYGRSLPESARSGGEVPVFGSNGVVGGHDVPLTASETIVIGRKGSHGEVNFSDKPCWPIDTTYFVDSTATKANLNWLKYRLAGAGLNQMNRAAAVPGLNREDAYRVEILLPPLEEQRRIAAILDQAETLRTQRRTALAQLDSLTQSLFLDMFGDPVTNLKFQTGTIRQFVEANSGKSAKAVLSESLTDVPIYGGNGINGWATTPLYEQPVLVFGRVGQQCGNAFLTEGPSWVTDNAIVVRIADASKLIATYVLHAFQGSDFSSRVKHLDLPFINQGMILDNAIPLPPFPLQQTFATRVQAIEALKATHRTALAELDALFASLQQRAFAGEL